MHGQDQKNVERKMSEALERVIAEQQKEIDRLKSLEKSNLDAWVRENKRNEKFMEVFWLFWRNPADQGCKRNMHSVLIEQGWCLSCERPMNWCECDYD